MLSKDCKKCMRSINQIYRDYDKNCACDPGCATGCRDNCKKSFCTGQCYCDKKHCESDIVTLLTEPDSCLNNYNNCNHNVEANDQKNEDLHFIV